MTKMMAKKPRCHDLQSRGRGQTKERGTIVDHYGGNAVLT
jgi:hypothetical protein